MHLVSYCFQPAPLALCLEVALAFDICGTVVTSPVKELALQVASCAEALIGPGEQDGVLEDFRSARGSIHHGAFTCKVKLQLGSMWFPYLQDGLGQTSSDGDGVGFEKQSDDELSRFVFAATSRVARCFTPCRRR